MLKDSNIKLIRDNRLALLNNSTIQALKICITHLNLKVMKDQKTYLN